MPSQRYKLTISYRGTAYHGWQAQTANALWKGPKPPKGHGIPTIQEILAFGGQHDVGLYLELKPRGPSGIEHADPFRLGRLRWRR